MVLPALPASPYKGLSAYSEQDAPFFFGRESECRIISANLRTRRLTLLYGPSGVGKSSVINAGVVYAIRRRWNLQMADPPRLSVHVNSSGAEVEQSRDSNSPPAPSNKLSIVIVFGDWHGSPLQSLPEAVFAGLRDSNVLSGNKEKHFHGLRLTEMLIEIAKDARDIELLIVLDQFEEYFVYHPTDEGPGGFADEFSRAVASAEVDANFLISIREDWLSKLDRFKGRVPSLFDNSIAIDHLSPRAARAAIEKPVEKYNEIVRANKDSQHSEISIARDFILGLLKQLEHMDDREDPDDDADNAGDNVSQAPPRIQTARLQIVLEHLWNTIKDDSHPCFSANLIEKPDTARHIIQSHVSESLGHLTDSEKRAAARFFQYLITDQGTKYASTAEGLSDRCNLPLPYVRDLLEKLSEPRTRVLNRAAPSPGRQKKPRYEITSDVLADPILEWAKDIRLKHQRRRVTRNWFIAVTALLVVFAVAALVFRSYQNQRQEQRRRETKERFRARRAMATLRKQDERIPYSRAVLRGHEGKVTSAVFTPDGQVLTASADGSAILWDVESKEPIRPFSADEGQLICARISSKGNLVATANSDGTVMLWNLATGENTQLRGPVGKHITDMSFNKRGDILASGNTMGELTLWDTTSGNIIKDVPGNSKAIRQLAFSPSGALLATASEDFTVRVSRAADWGEVTLLAGHTDKVNGIAFSPDEKLIASASADSTVRVWNLGDGTSRIFSGHSQNVNGVDFDPTGTRLLTASDDGTARIWNLDNRNGFKLDAGARVLSASFSPSGLQVVTAGEDGVARIWSAKTGKPLLDLRGHDGPITYVTYSKDGQFVLTASDDNTAIVWYAPESGEFEVDTLTIEARPNRYQGDCPITINFIVRITAKGSGTVVYRFRGSDGRIWPLRELAFDGPGDKTINWYWRVGDDFAGSETIEIVEPNNFKRKASFLVKCTKADIPTTQPSASPSP